MGKLSTESWLGRVGLVKGRGRKKGAAEASKATVGVLAFEVASLLSKAAHLWRSLADDQIARLRDEILRQEGVRKLVSDDDDFLLGLALAEILDSLGSLAPSAARLGRRCADSALQRFEHLFADLVKNSADLYGFQLAAKKMDRKVRKMERLAAATSNLYQELEVLAELEQGLRRMQGSADPAHQNCLGDYKQKVAWQRQQVKHLREVSLWNRSYDYAGGMLARSLFTIVVRIKQVFGFQQREAAADVTAGGDARESSLLSRSHSVLGQVHSSVHPSDGHRIHWFASGPLVRSGTRSGPFDVTTRRAIKEQCLAPTGMRHNSKTRWAVTGRPFKGCMVGGNESPVLQGCVLLDSVSRKSNAVSRTLNGVEDAEAEAHFQGNIFTTNLSLSMFESRRKLLNAPASTLGAAALALHYANVIIVIEKLLASPHLIAPDARDDLYSMLPTSIRAALRARLKSYAKNLTSSVYDPVLAAEWSEAITRILEWLAPLAHNMIRWQSDRNFEQQHLISSNNVLLLQTLYFANQAKAEAAITELLVGLNYLWRFGRELNEKAMLECVSSRNFDDCLDLKG